MARLSDAELKKIGRKFDRKRKAMRKVELERLAAALSNEDGWKAIEAITDEEWNEAVKADEGKTGGE